MGGSGLDRSAAEKLVWVFKKWASFWIGILFCVLFSKIFFVILLIHRFGKAEDLVAYASVAPAHHLGFHRLTTHLVYFHFLKLYIAFSSVCDNFFSKFVPNFLAVILTPNCLMWSMVWLCHKWWNVLKAIKKNGAWRYFIYLTLFSGCLDRAQYHEKFHHR